MASHTFEIYSRY